METSQVIIKPSQQLIDAFLNESSKLEDILLKELEDNEIEICNLIQDYQTGRYTVNYCTDYAILDLHKNTGSFSVNYEAEEYNGCKDMLREIEDDLIIDFDLDLEKFELVLTGPEHYEKLSPNEEL